MFDAVFFVFLLQLKDCQNALALSGKISGSLVYKYQPQILWSCGVALAPWSKLLL